MYVIRRLCGEDQILRLVREMYEAGLRAGLEPIDALEKAKEFVLELHRIEYE